MQTVKNNPPADECSLPRMMLIRDLAKETGIAYSCIRRWCVSGEFKGYVKVGNRYLINVNRFAEFLDCGAQ